MVFGYFDMQLEEFDRTFEEWLEWTIDEDSTAKFRDFISITSYPHAKIVYNALMAERRQQFLDSR